MKNLGLNSIDTNYKTEVVASSLIEKGLDPQKLLIIRRKGDKKDVSKDIDQLRYEYSSFDEKEYLYLYTNRESIYESLPEGLFHQAQSSKRQLTKEDIIQDIRSQRNKEKTTRLFFQPFEIALDKTLVEAQTYELKYDKAFLHNSVGDIFKEYWEIFQHLDKKQALLFIKMLPIIDELPRDLSLTAKVMSAVLECPIRITKGKKSIQNLDKSKEIKLKDWNLGLTSILGSRVCPINIDLVLHIGPVSTEQMILFETNKKNDHILKELINLLIPFDRRVNVKYTTIASESKFHLSSQDHTTYLGINTTL